MKNFLLNFPKFSYRVKKISRKPFCTLLVETPVFTFYAHALESFSGKKLCQDKNCIRQMKTTGFVVILTPFISRELEFSLHQALKCKEMVRWYDKDLNGVFVFVVYKRDCSRDHSCQCVKCFLISDYLMKTIYTVAYLHGYLSSLCIAHFISSLRT